MKIFRKSILPIYFKANGVASGIKKRGKLDLGLFYSHLPAKAACKFTKNKIQAAPILQSKEHLKKSKDFRLIIVNSGNANSFTGKQGLKDAEAMAGVVASLFKINKESVLVASTGIIGKRMPLPKIKKAIPALVKGLSQEGIHKAKEAIITTDTFIKEITARFDIKGREITVCGIAKGAGMIAPDLATMLCFIFTDANITQGALDKALQMAVDNSFNSITVDGCMSTNDSVMLLGNGAAANELIDIHRKMPFAHFTQALNLVCLELAKMVVKDAEGATKFIQINVNGARNFSEAKKAALAIANSNLFKAAIYGEDPNFGRIVAAVGASGINIEEEKLKVKLGRLNKKKVNVDVIIGSGGSSATVYTSDLTPEYVKINAEYN